MLKSRFVSKTLTLKSFPPVSPVLLCPCRSYKCAGTTIKKYLISLCGGNPKVVMLHSGHLTLPRSMPSRGHDFVQRAWPRLHLATSTFTFVRDPVSRFVSSLIEMRRRGDKFAVAVEREAMESGRPAIEVAIEMQYKHDLYSLNAHIIPQ